MVIMVKKTITENCKKGSMPRRRRGGGEEERRRGGAHGDKLTVLTVTLKGVVAVGVASIVGVVLSEEPPPGMLRRRPVLSGGDSAKTNKKSSICVPCIFPRRRRALTAFDSGKRRALHSRPIKPPLTRNFSKREAKSSKEPRGAAASALGPQQDLTAPADEIPEASPTSEN
ncbi:hypothetical protein EYF80_048182 [Liparis tanakae]|uniref:Uncharacterized protein n=1 Tax=Liparis tanakae TaxID=230148 RepID=A0A4Z2FK84_9TELE|nr:hypothetical protein EYF80_048182 [Liparis tanakae]